LAALATLVLLGALAFIGYYERDYARLAQRLDGDLASLRNFRWDRPVLRGAMGDGNAADEVYAALNDFQPLGAATRRAWAEKVFYGQPASPDENNRLVERALSLRALRGAAQQRWSHTDLELERGLAMRIPDYAKLIDASLGLLMSAQAASPDECLQIAADVIRIGQDVVPTAPLEAASASTHLSALAARVLTRCAESADLTALRRASHELRVLATHPAPTGSCIELEAIAEAMELRNRAALSNKSNPLRVLATVLERPKLLAAWSNYTDPARFRQITPDRYPDAIDDWQRGQDDHQRASDSQVLSRLQDDMRGQAVVRMLVIGLSALAERAYRGSLPAQPASLSDAALRDPFRGQPFHYRVAFNGSEFALWSVGTDYRDDAGSEEWTETGPRDVTLHFPLIAHK
jgi:hypothetical protein